MATVVFFHEHPREELWNDGMAATLRLLAKEVELTVINLYKGQDTDKTFDFAFGIGGFGSIVDKRLANYKGRKGLYVAGCVATIPAHVYDYDVLFYENDWVLKNYLNGVANSINMIKCFSGVNTEVYKPNGATKVIDYLGVGALASWKRWEKMKDKKGVRLVIGEYQLNNQAESLAIAKDLLADGIGVLPLQSAETLCEFLNMSKTLYIPASTVGGGERAVCEALACGLDVEVENDNPKLQEYLTWLPLPDQHYCLKQFLKAIYET